MFIRQMSPDRNQSITTANTHIIKREKESSLLKSGTLLHPSSNPFELNLPVPGVKSPHAMQKLLVGKLAQP
eukprot:m.221878 g.221878  ORF g.221878 m.221878 type:complete len:71 (+) comp26320_c0_seq2:22-234(+)